jgi:hypothetical protein
MEKFSIAEVHSAEEDLDFHLQDHGYQCCFCTQPIEPASPDPCQLELRINFGGDPNMSQALFCHASCLRSVLSPSVPTILDAT